MRFQLSLTSIVVPKGEGKVVIAFIARSRRPPDPAKTGAGPDPGKRKAGRGKRKAGRKRKAGEAESGTVAESGTKAGRKRKAGRVRLGSGKRDGSDIVKLGGPADVRPIFNRARHFDFGPLFAGDPWDDRPTLGPNVSRFPSAIPAGQRGGLVARSDEALPVPARRRFD